MTKRGKSTSIISVEGPTNPLGKFLPKDQLLSFLLGTFKANPIGSDSNSKYTKSWWSNFIVSQPFWWITTVAGLCIFDKRSFRYRPRLEWYFISLLPTLWEYTDSTQQRTAIPTKLEAVGLNLKIHHEWWFHIYLRLFQFSWLQNLLL